MLIVNSIFKYYLSCFLGLSSAVLLAQEFDVVQIQSAYYPKQFIEESGAEGEIGFFEWGVQVAIPQAIKSSKDSIILIHRMSYGNLKVDAEANPTAGPMVDAEKYYHNISYNLGLVYSLKSTWHVVVNLTPTIASDFEEKLRGDDLLFQASTLIVKSKNKSWKYGLGLAYNTRFGRQLFIPMGLLKYETKRVALDMVLPNKLNLMFKASNNKIHYGLKAGLNGTVINNSTEIQSISNVIDEVGYSRLIVGPAITLRLKNAFNLNLQGGLAVARRLEFIDVNNNIIDRTPQASPFFAIGISFAPNLMRIESGLND